MRERILGLVRWVKRRVRRLYLWWTGKTECIKPTGTVSKLGSCHDGIHPLHSPSYFRRVNNPADPDGRRH